MLDLIASTPLIRAAALIGVFLAVGALALAALMVANRQFAMRGKLKALAVQDLPGIESQSLTKSRNSAWEKLVDRIEGSGLSLADSKDTILRERLVNAGYDSPAAPRVYTLIRLVLVIALPLLLVLYITWRGTELSMTRLYIYGSILALLGLFVPALFVRAKADRRREDLVNGFPDCLDLMLVCVEAGLGLSAAMDRVAREMVMSHPLVSDVLTKATLRLRAGASREEALRRMADEAQVAEIRSFATLMIQTDKLGTSLATTLRVYASEMRERRRMRAEEKAHRLPVLISIPLVTCMLPVMIGTLMIPASVRVVNDMIPAMQG